MADILEHPLIPRIIIFNGWIPFMANLAYVPEHGRQRLETCRFPTDYCLISIVCLLGILKLNAKSQVQRHFLVERHMIICDVP